MERRNKIKRREQQTALSLGLLNITATHTAVLLFFFFFFLRFTKLSLSLLERLTTLVNLSVNLPELSECVGAGFTMQVFIAQVITCTLHSMHALQNKFYALLYQDKSDTVPWS